MRQLVSHLARYLTLLAVRKPFVVSIVAQIRRQRRPEAARQLCRALPGSQRSIFVLLIQHALLEERSSALGE
jgi:hypothetical protein